MDTFPPSSLRALAQEVSDLLRHRGHKVCLVETACGGLLSSTMLSLPGASKIYAGGLTLYTLPSRIAFSDWTPAHIENYSGPTPAVCEGLASSARTRLCNLNFNGGIEGEKEGSLWVLAESGTAGPTSSGSGPNRQPGYVALAVVGPDGRAMSKELQTGKESRVDNMVDFAHAALKLLKEALSDAAGTEKI